MNNVLKDIILLEENGNLLWLYTKNGMKLLQFQAEFESKFDQIASVNQGNWYLKIPVNALEKMIETHIERWNTYRKNQLEWIEQEKIDGEISPLITKT